MAVKGVGDGPKIGSKTETATLVVYGLWQCRFAFVLESISPLSPRG